MALIVAAVTAIGGAALGEAFKLLSNSVIEAHREASEFTPLFNDLKSTLERYNELVQSINNLKSDVPPMQDQDKLQVVLEEGRQLVLKCSSIHPLKLKMCCIKSGYVGKPRALGISLQTLLHTIRLHVDVNMKDIEISLLTSMNRTLHATRVHQAGNPASYAVPDPPSYTVGLEGPLEDLKMNFLQNERASMYVLRAPGGYGKTTLAQKFCQEEHVKEECTDGYYSEHFVTQHDLLRDLAIHQIAHDSTGHSKRLNINISGDDIPEWWQNHESRPKMTSLLSISTDEAFKFKWDEMHLPKAKVLVLNLQSAYYAFPKFKKKLSKSLKALIVTNYGVLPAEVSNFTSLCYLPQLKRIRFERLSIPPITKKDINLKCLQKLSLFMCSMGQAIGNNGPIKFFEAFPSLEEINIDYCSDLKVLPADICSLIHLRKLSITNCHKLSVLPEEIGELVNLELLRLISCTDLVKFPDSVRRLKKLKVLDISHCVSIKEFPEHIGKLGCLEKLNMRECSRLTALPDSVSKLGSLIDVICDHDTIGLWELHMPDDLRKNMKIREVREIYTLDWLHQ